MPRPFRSVFTVALGFACIVLVTAGVRGQEEIIWTDARCLNVEGRGWTDTKAYFDRLPARAEKLVRPPVWNLSRNSAGMVVRFSSDATNIHARWSLTSPNLAMPHMPATGVSGLDLYVSTGHGKWHWLATGVPKSESNTTALATGLLPGQRDFLLYLPLYNGVRSVEVGIERGASITSGNPWGKGTRKPVVFYGTSIMQGGCASRPGMAHAAILGRRLNWPTINLGFSGNGKMEPEMADLLAELDPAAYVLDCLPNMTEKEVAERVEPFVLRLRKAHEKTPLVLVEDRNYENAFLMPQRRAHNESNQAALKAAYKRLQQNGVKKLYYVRADNLLGADGEGTVDSSHPTDLGFMRYADVIEPVLKPLLKPLP